MKRTEFAEKHLLNRSILSYLLYPASLCYAGLMLFRRRILQGRGYRAPFKVISVGNLTSGGSGKTPIAIALCKELQKRGLRVAYSSRGYKSKLEQGAKQISDGNSILYPASVAGDEAVMAATMLPRIPVFSGRKRKQVLKLAAIKYPNLDYMIMDDAFQHLKVERDYDLVVFDTRTGLGNGFVLPAGYLRESVAAISAKTLCLFHHKNGHEINPQLENRFIQRGLSWFRVQSSTDCVSHLAVKLESSALKQMSFTLISAIAHPESFENSVRELGIKFSRHLVFPDHYDYMDPSLREQLNNDPTECFLTTAKDAVKLNEILGDRLYVLELQTTLAQELIDILL